MWSLAGKTVLVTGATRGIGFEAAVGVARLGARPILLGRDAARLARATAALRARAAIEPASCLCDLSSQADIRRAAAGLLADHPRIDVLVNNAGGVQKRRRLTPEGLEWTFATNHLGPFLLTNLLLERIRRSAPARIVTVASIGHRRGTLDFEDLGYERGYWILRAYARSKLANVLFARELASRLAGSGVTSNSVHPGSVGTDIWNGAPLWTKPFIGLVLAPRFVSVETGAASVIRLAADPALSHTTGAYFEEQRMVAPSALAQDESVASRLWRVSEDLTGLRGSRET